MPSVSPQELVARLAKGKPVPGVLLLGSDGYLRDMCRRGLIDAYVDPGARDWGVRKFSADEDDVDAILGQARTMPMLAPQQVIFVAEADAWERFGEERRESLVKQLAEYLANPAPFTVLVFESVELDQRMKLGKLLLEKTLAVSVELSSDPAERTRLAASVALGMAKDIGVELKDDAAEELCDRLCGELAAIHTEIEKLAAYAGERKRITVADVELLVLSTQKYEVWDLADMLAAREPAKALAFLDRLLRDGEQAVALLGGIAWMYRKLLEAQELPASAGGWQAASRLKMGAAKAELAVKQSRKFSRAQLAGGLVALYEADNRLKSGGSANQHAIMEFLVTQLAGPAGAAARAK